MSTTPTRNIALTLELEGYIRGQVQSGRFSSASEVVRSALRLMIERDGLVASRMQDGLSHAAKSGGESAR